MNIENNPFECPNKYRKLILNSELLKFPKKKINGKSLACLFLTRFCTVGCSFCFFNSAPLWRRGYKEDQFTKEGLEKFIKFSDEANLGYLLVSGGGEPLNLKNHIIRLLESVNVDRIVLVTSGNWAKNYKAGFKYLKDIHDAILRNKNKIHVVVRVSVSDYHAVKLGIDCAYNIIKIFEKHFKDKNSYFSTQIKSFNNDKSLLKLLDKLNIPKFQNTESLLESDNPILEKIIPKKSILKLDSGYEIVLGVSNIFDASLDPDLNDIQKYSYGMKIIEKDIQYSENYNPSIVKNHDGSYGLDWSINYNGNICIWQNQTRDTYKNLYEDSFSDIYKTYFNDPLTYSFVEKGNIYRENIIKEVNPKAVLRSKAIGLRDALGAILFEEEKTRLYYTIRALQDFIEEGKITISEQKKWPLEISNLINISIEDLKHLFHSSYHNIIHQKQREQLNKEEWQDFLYLISLNHYDLSKDEISSAVSFYNKNFNEHHKNIKDIKINPKNKVRRLTERITYIKEMDLVEI